jgi:signal transduction histidine kinase
MSPGDLAELLATFNDITGRLTSTHESLRAEVERLQGELTEANGQLERSRRLAALGQMAAGIAHEVRNPLGSIRLYARMLTQDLEGQDGPRTLAEKIGRCAAGLEAIVGDVLNFSREFTPRAGEGPAEDLFDAVLESVCHDGTPGWREVEFRREGGDVPVHADAALIRQALVNLARNAVEAAREGPGPRRVTLSARRGQDGGAELRVRDSGPGIPREVLARLFNPFFTTRASGTGLGLAIVHRIVDAHGGRVVARNAPGGGAEFVIHLPPARTARGSTPTPTPSDSPTPTITIRTRTDAEVA